MGRAILPRAILDEAKCGHRGLEKCAASGDVNGRTEDVAEIRSLAGVAPIAA